MQQIEVRDEVYTALQRLATGFHRTPDEVLATLLNLPVPATDAADPLAAYILSAEFRAKFTDADKYVALLSWLATQHAEEFAEFVRGQSSGRRYLGHSRAEVVEACRHNQARQIDHTPYWAIMNLDTATKRRFLARVLEFVGCREAVADFVCGAIGMHRPHRRTRFPSLLR